MEGGREREREVVWNAGGGGGEGEVVIVEVMVVVVERVVYLVFLHTLTQVYYRCIGVLISLRCVCVYVGSGKVN